MGLGGERPGGADEDTDGGFPHGGWTWPYWHDDIGALFGAAMQASDASDAVKSGRMCMTPSIRPVGVEGLDSRHAGAMVGAAAL